MNFSGIKLWGVFFLMNMSASVLKQKALTCANLIKKISSLLREIMTELDSNKEGLTSALSQRDTGRG